MQFLKVLLKLYVLLEILRGYLGTVCNLLEYPLNYGVIITNVAVRAPITLLYNFTEGFYNLGGNWTYQYSFHNFTEGSYNLCGNVVTSTVFITLLRVFIT